ncbi:ANK1 [Symbiodinium sp. CCMP2592]|nr:ANK1 [Symbiodinium sp. CCMP2592]
MTGLHLTEQQWSQASGGFAHAGLGLRSCARHALAAYLASFGASLDGCRELGPQFNAADVLASPEVLAALEAFNAQLPPAQRLTVAAALALKLSQLLDQAAWDTLAPATPSERAVLRSEAGLGARAFLAALPSGRTRMEKASFVAELRFRLGLPDAAEDTWCPKCDAVLDRFSHHAASASCVAGASMQVGAAAESYARHKEDHLGTAAACQAQGVQFAPMVVETTGHWEAGASRTLNQIAGAVAARTGAEPGPLHDSLLQELSVVVRSFRARAALRRRAELET